ncbi:MAG: carbonic anhydrase family protein [Leptospiraceae bacterium]|nr:carbonic anhydrase family protein [Leptospiraceae bacterium]
MGPQNWGELSPEYETCTTGTLQSPIDIHGAKSADLPALQLNYIDSNFIVTNNGHTIKASFENGGTLKVGEDSYNLIQVHFHSPGEAAVDGDRSDMVAHLVHSSEAGDLAVIGVLLEAGNANAAIQKIWDQMPQEVGAENKASGTLNAQNITGSELAYYTFQGSLTTPPCTEGVRWIVLKNPVTLSAGQIAAFKELYPMNARPIQPTNDREILVSK